MWKCLSLFTLSLETKKLKHKGKKQQQLLLVWFFLSRLLLKNLLLAKKKSAFVSGLCVTKFSTRPLHDTAEIDGGKMKLPRTPFKSFTYNEFVTKTKSAFVSRLCITTFSTRPLHDTQEIDGGKMKLQRTPFKSFTYKEFVTKTKSSFVSRLCITTFSIQHVCCMTLRKSMAGKWKSNGITVEPRYFEVPGEMEKTVRNS